MFGRRNVGVSATHSASKTVSTLEQLSDAQLLCRAARQVLKVRCMVLPDMFVEHDSPAAMYAAAGLDTKGIVAKVFEALGKDARREVAKLR